MIQEKHIIFAQDTPFLFNYLLTRNKDILDFFYDNDPKSFVQLQYQIEKYNFKAENKYIFHVFLNNKDDRISKESVNCATYFRGIAIYHFLFQHITKKNLTDVAFVFYSFLSLKQIREIYPVILPDLEQNNFIRLPDIANGLENIQNYPFYPDYAIHLQRGELLCNDDNIGSTLQDKTILFIDDEYSDSFGEVYTKLLNCNKIIGIKQAKSEYNDVKKTVTSFLKEINEENIDIIISDLYLSEEHKKVMQNRFEAKDLSGFKVLDKLFSQKEGLKNVPLIFHTSTTRIWNYKLFQKYDNFKGWIPKPEIQDIHKQQEELKSYYKLLTTIFKQVQNGK